MVDTMHRFLVQRVIGDKWVTIAAMFSEQLAHDVKDMLGVQAKGEVAFRVLEIVGVVEL